MNTRYNYHWYLFEKWYCYYLITKDKERCKSTRKQEGSRWKKWQNKKEKQVEGKKRRGGVQRGHREKWSQWTLWPASLRTKQVAFLVVVGRRRVWGINKINWNLKSISYVTEFAVLALLT